jgi:hypothetical protein
MMINGGLKAGKIDLFFCVKKKKKGRMEDKCYPIHDDDYNNNHGTVKVMLQNDTVDIINVKNFDEISKISSKLFEYYEKDKEKYEGYDYLCHKNKGYCLYNEYASTLRMIKDKDNFNKYVKFLSILNENQVTPFADRQT